MPVKQTIAPIELPVTLSETKIHLRVDTNDEDTLISSLIGAATLQAVAFTKMQLVTATYEWTQDCFTDEIILPYPLLQAVTSVQYYDNTNTLVTLVTTVYELDNRSQPGRICLAEGESWPDTFTRKNAVIVTYTAGFGAANDVPDDIKAAILLIVGHLYENKQDVITGTIVSEVPLASRYILQPYIRRFG